MLVENALFATLDPTVRRTETATAAATRWPTRSASSATSRTSWWRRSARRWRRSATRDLVLHVVDASDEDPEGQISAVRAVFADMGAGDVKELMVLNKADLADPAVLARLLRREPHSIVVSARTGEGIDDLLTAIEHDLPRPGVELEALVPYDRGDLVARIHAEGEMLKEEHTDHGTLVRALIHPDLAAQLGPFRTVGAV